MTNGDNKLSEALIQYSNDAILIIDSNGKIISGNPAFFKLNGSNKGIIGKQADTLFSKKIKDKCQCEKVKFTNINGKKIDVLLTAFFIEKQGSEIKQYYYILNNRSEVKKEQFRTRDNEERLESIWNTVVDGIITIDKKGHVLSLNPAAEKLFGYTPEELIGKNISTLMPEPYHSEHDGYIHNYLKSGHAKVIGIGREVTALRKDGTQFPMELAVSQMRIGNEINFTGVIRDITDRKKMEKVKNEFISTVSHELRTPLTSIKGAIGLIEKLSDDFPEKVKKLLTMASRNSERLTLLINDILDLEKIESGKLKFEFEHIDLFDVAKIAIEENHAMAQSHNVDIKLDAEQIESFTIYADKNRLLQVFANLLSNAIKYSPKNSTINLNIEKNGAFLRVKVIDEGSGIPANFRSKVFSRFAQADSSDTKEKGGTGLGLSITKAIIEHHRGFIDYESAKNNGTCFYFDLPAVAILNADCSETSNVLICEDNTDLAMLLKDLVNEQGYKSDISTTGELLLELIEKNEYELILLDLTLPDIDGLELIPSIRKNSKKQDVKIIIISGRANESHKQFFGDARLIQNWLQKPVDIDVLKSCIFDCMSGSDEDLNILHVEDDQDIVQIVQILLQDMAHYHHTASLKGARNLLLNNHYDLILLDLNLEDGNGSDLIEEIPDGCPIILFSATQPSKSLTSKVHKSLTKSMTNNDYLARTINDCLRSTNK